MRSRSLNVTRVAVILVMLASARPLPAQPSPQPCDLLCLSGQAREALAARQYDDYLRLARAVAMRAPDHPGGHYAVARAFALLGQSDSAFVALERLLNLGAAPDIAADSVFAPISTAPAFQALEAEFERNATPILRGQAAFSLPNADLVPEALTWDPARRRWLIGSLAKRKIIAANDEGASTNFISHPDLLRVVGIHADPGRELLWFATWEPTERIDPSGSGRITRTRLFKADLATGRILGTYVPPDTAESRLLNDLAIAPNGDLYVPILALGGSTVWPPTGIRWRSSRGPIALASRTPTASPSPTTIEHSTSRSSRASHGSIRTRVESCPCARRQA